MKILYSRGARTLRSRPSVRGRHERSALRDVLWNNALLLLPPLLPMRCLALFTVTAGALGSNQKEMLAYSVQQQLFTLPIIIAL